MYFEWTEQPFVRPPELDGASPVHDVVVLGAGPVGLATALSLAQWGLGVVVLESRSQVSDGSRAVGMQQRTAQFFDHLGVGRAFLDKAKPRLHNRVYHGQRLLYQTDLAKPDGQRHHDIYTLQQCWTEQILLDALRAHPSVQVRWHSQVESVQQDAHEVRWQVGTPQGSCTVRSRYAVAADGGNGSMRKWLDVPSELTMPANVSDSAFVISDFHVDQALPFGRSLWLQPSYAPDSLVLLHSQPFGVMRLDYAVPQGVDPDQAAQPDQVRQRIADHLLMMGVTAPWELLWHSVYRVRARSLRDYRQGRVLFAGDAAHPHPIFGGRGLNHGLADAFNLGWKLALHHRGLAGPGLLDSYSTERRGLVLKSFQSLARSTRFMTQATDGLKTMRRAALALAGSQAFVADLFDAYKAPNEHQLDAGLPTALVGNSPVGQWLADPLLHWGDSCQAHLSERLPRGFTALVLVPDNVPQEFEFALHALQAQAAASQVPLCVRVIADVPGAHSDWAHDPKRTLFELYGVAQTSIALVRPDRYIAAWVIGFDVPTLLAALHTATGWGEPSADTPSQRAMPLEPAPLPSAFEQMGEALDQLATAQKNDFLASLALVLANDLADPALVASAIANTLKAYAKPAHPRPTPDIDPAAPLNPHPHDVT